MPLHAWSCIQDILAWTFCDAGSGDTWQREIQARVLSYSSSIKAGSGAGSIDRPTDHKAAERVVKERMHRQEPVQLRSTELSRHGWQCKTLKLSIASHLERKLDWTRDGSCQLVVGNCL